MSNAASRSHQFSSQQLGSLSLSHTHTHTHTELLYTGTQTVVNIRMFNLIANVLLFYQNSGIKEHDELKPSSPLQRAF